MGEQSHCAFFRRHALGLPPKFLDGIVRAGLRLEHVDHHVAVVQEDPAAFLVAFDAHPPVTQLFLQYAIDLFADGVQLPPAAATDDDEEVEHAGQFPQVEDHDVAAAVFGGHACGGLCPAKPTVSVWSCSR